MLGLDEKALHFCRKRVEKAPICKALNVSHFIDDWIDVLILLKSVRHRFLFGPQEVTTSVAGVKRVETWAAVANALL